MCFMALINLITLGAFSSCSSLDKVDIKEEKRTVASRDYECTFTEIIDGQKSSFIFTPDNLKLVVTNEKFGSETLFLEEDNFISGGFTYIQDKKSKIGQWPVKKIEFISFSSAPKVTISFQRTPSSVKAKTFSKSCE